MGQVGESCVPRAAAPSTEFGAGRLANAMLSRDLAAPGSKMER